MDYFRVKWLLETEMRPYILSSALSRDSVCHAKLAPRFDIRGERQRSFGEVKRCQHNDVTEREGLLLDYL